VKGDRASHTGVAAIGWCMVGCAAALLAGWLLKSRCVGISVERYQFRQLCYNDVQSLYRARGIAQGLFPYVHGALNNGTPVHGAIEYPVLTGLFMWLMGEVTTGFRDYFYVTALILAATALTTTLLLARMDGLRALRWALAPSLALYTFHNWDVLAVAAAVVGIWFWFRERRVAAAIAFGIGAALKLFPLLFLPALFFESLFEGRPRRGVVEFLAGAGCFVVINLPIALINFNGWWATYRFQSVRLPNHDSLWSLGGRLVGHPDITQINVASATLIVGSVVGVLAAAWLLARSSGQYPFLQACAATLALVLLWSKVQSPQYILWVLPFFVVLNVSLVWWLLYSIVDVLVYVGILRFYYDYSRVASATFHIGVWLRSGLLLALAPVFLYATVALVQRRAVVLGGAEPRTAAPV
jgi:uncharacterized membrane protein